jgi:hypothetical protein
MATESLEVFKFAWTADAGIYIVLVRVFFEGNLGEELSIAEAAK